MNPLHQCEQLFYRADELGTGIAALGDMLQWAPIDTYQDTLLGLGAVLRNLGKNISSLNTEFLADG